MKKWRVNQACRLLTFAKEKNFSFTTRDVRWAIEHNRCLVNGKPERFASARLKKGDLVEIDVAARPRFAFEPMRVLHEEAHFLAYDKPEGISSENLAALLGLRLVHRLDRDTTGVMLFAKTEEGQATLESHFRKRTIKKTYLAVVQGIPGKSAGKIEKALAKCGSKSAVRAGGKPAFTEWEVVRSTSRRTLLRCYPLTGRMHQIRAHLAHIGHPLVGDIDYGGPFAYRPLLHAESVTFGDYEIRSEIDIEKFLNGGYTRHLT